LPYADMSLGIINLFKEKINIYQEKK